MNNKKDKKYGLISYIALIAGSTIGSGIYFKIGKITELSGANLGFVILNFSIVALGLIFGGIAMSEFATISKGNGGVVTYFDEHISRNSATAFSWYQTFAYYPVLVAVVSWVSGLYIIQLFKLDGIIVNNLIFNGATKENANYFLFFIALILGIILMFAFTVGTWLSRVNGARFQVMSFFVKFLPVLVIFIIAIIVKSNPKLNNSSSVIDKLSEQHIENIQTFSKGTAFLAALPTVAFMFEGWVVATTVVNETKNRNRTVKLGYIIAPIIVFVFYVLYAVLTNSILTPAGVVSSGQKVAPNAIKAIFLKMTQEGSIVIDSIILLVLVISVLGVLNGLTIAGVRMPQALAEKNMLPDNNNKMANTVSTTGLSKKSVIIFFISTLVSIILFYTIFVLTKQSIDISDLTIQFSYLFYIILYIKLIIYTKQGKVKSKIVGYVSAVLGLVSSLIIFISGFMQAKQNTLSLIAIVIFGIIVFIIYLLGYFYSVEVNNKELKEITKFKK